MSGRKRAVPDKTGEQNRILFRHERGNVLYCRKFHTPQAANDSYSECIKSIYLSIAWLSQYFSLLRLLLGAPRCGITLLLPSKVRR